MRFSRLAGSFPCPVLTQELDESPYISGELKFELKVDDTTSPNYLEIESGVTQPEIQALIANGSANLALGVHCDQTYYYELIDLSNKPRQKITLDEKSVFGTVYFFLVVKAKKATLGFAPSGLDPSFAGLSFDVRCGDLLAVSHEIAVHYGLPPLRLGESIFELVLQPERQTYEFGVDLGEEKIEIGVGERLNELLQMNSVHSSGRRKNISSVYLSALVEVLYCIREESHEGKPWFESIRTSMASIELDVMDTSWEPLVVAQQLLRHPYISLFEDESR